MSNRWLNVVAFFLPLYSFSLNMGVELSVYKLLPIVVFVSVMLKGQVHKIKVSRLFLILVVYIFVNTSVNVISNIGAGEFDYAINNGWSVFKVYTHMPVQLILIFFSLAQIFSLTHVLKEKFCYKSFINSFINGNLFSLITGLFLYLMLKIDIVLIPVFFDENMARLSGLGGEPRHFSAFIVIALTMILIDKTNSILSIRNRQVKIYTLVAGLLLSLSTSSIIAFALSFSIILIMHGVIGKNVFKFALTIVVVFIFWGSELIEILNHRILDRILDLDKILYFAPKDALAIYFLKDNFDALLFGVGSGGITFHTMQAPFLDLVSNDLVLNTMIIQSVYNGEIGGSLSPSSFSIKFISEHGIVGFSVLILFFCQIIKRMKHTVYSKFSISLSLTVLAMSFIASALIVYVYMIIISVLYAQSQRNKSF
jgi:hypothetical protein